MGPLGALASRLGVLTEKSPHRPGKGEKFGKTVKGQNPKKGIPETLKRKRVKIDPLASEEAGKPKRRPHLGKRGTQ